MTPKPGYEFTSSTAATVNTDSTVTSKDLKYDGTLIITYAFPATSNAVKYEAEAAVLSAGMSINSDNPGFSGTGHADGFGGNAGGHSVTFTVNASNAGDANLVIGYANGNSDDAAINMLVNGVPTTVVLLKTGNWGTWGTATVKVNVNQGPNTIKLEDGVALLGIYPGVNLDYIAVTTMTLPLWNTGSVTTSNVTTSSLDLTWSSAIFPDGVAAYKIYQDENLIATLGNVTSHNVTGLTKFATYKFKIEAVNSNGNITTDGPFVTLTIPGDAIKYEAEAAVLSAGMSIKTDHPGFSGTGHADGFGGNAGGHSVTFTVTASNAGDANLVIGYANGNSDDAAIKMSVNGKSTTVVLPIIVKGNWDVWGTATVKVNLNKGSNTIKLEDGVPLANNYPGVNLDYIEIVALPAPADITTANVSITTPTLNGVVSTIATVDSNAGYTASGITWSPVVSGTYASNTAYTASVILTPKAVTNLQAVQQ